jgi:hypothetical protein
LPLKMPEKALVSCKGKSVIEGDLMLK